MKHLKKILAVVAAMSVAPVFAGCMDSDADVASRNLSKAADNFEVQRSVVFYNGITDKYLLQITGLCSLGNNDDRGTQITVTCKTGKNEYKKHYLGLSDNVTYVVQQLEAANVSTDRYRVVFKPQALIPDIDLRANTSGTP